MKKTKKYIPAMFSIAAAAFVGLSISLFAVDTAEAAEGDEVQITLSGSSISADNSIVEISGSTATITEAGSYFISGTLSDGQIIVNAPDEDVELVLDDVDITNSSGPAIYVIESSDTDIVLAEGSTNTLEDGSSYSTTGEEDEPTATIFSMSDLKIKGEDDSSLTVIGNYNDAIVSKDDLKIKNATITVTSVDDGLRGKDSVEIEGSDLDITVEGDAIKSDNTDDEKGIITVEDSTIVLEAGDDGIHGVNGVDILSGTIDITDSYEGIEGKVINLYDGEISIVSSDDGLNAVEDSDSTSNQFAAASGVELNIYGGEIIIDADGDGIDSNGTATMSGGMLIVNGPTNSGNGAIDVNGTFDISGGTLIAIGSSGMAETPSSSSSQYSLQVNLNTTQTAGTVVSLEDPDGNEVFSYTTEKQFQSVVYSSEELEKGETYTFLLDGEEYTTLTISSSVTTSGSGGMSGGMGGGQTGQMNFGQMGGGQRPQMIDQDEDDEDDEEEDQEDDFQMNGGQMNFGQMGGGQMGFGQFPRMMRGSQMGFGQMDGMNGMLSFFSGWGSQQN